jgi:hypothetical protein
MLTRNKNAAQTNIRSHVKRKRTNATHETRTAQSPGRKRKANQYSDNWTLTSKRLSMTTL